MIKVLLGNKLIYIYFLFQLHERAYVRGMDTTLLLCGMSLRVSMGLADRRKTAKNLVDSRKN